MHQLHAWPTAIRKVHICLPSLSTALGTKEEERRSKAGNEKPCCTSTGKHEGKGKEMNGDCKYFISYTMNEEETERRDGKLDGQRRKGMQEKW